MPSAHTFAKDAPRAVLIGIALMAAGDFAFSTNDAVAKVLIARHTPAEVLMWRSAFAGICMLPFVWRAGRSGLYARTHAGLQAARVALAVAELVCFYNAIVALPLADVMTFYLACPVFTAALSPLLLGEKVTPGRWAAIAAGFGGVVIAMRPSAASLSAGTLWSVAGALCLALMMIASRKMRDIPDLTIVFQQTIGVLAGGAIWFVAEGTGMPVPSDVPLLGVLGIVAMGAHFLINRSLKYAAAAVVAPVQYTLLLWAVVYGWGLFGDVPDTATLAGAAVIIVAGICLVMQRDANTEPVEAA